MRLNNIFNKILLMILVAIILNPVSSLAEENMYKAGVVFYNQGKYQQALTYLSSAVRDNPSDVNALYYFANSLVKVHNVEYAQMYYKKVVEISPDSKVAALSKKALEDITSFKSKLTNPFNSMVVNEGILYNSENSYIDDLSLSGNTIHWSKEKMPLNVYVEPSDFREQKAPIIKAFLEWEGATKRLISFKFVTNPDKAQITVAWEKSMNNIPGDDFGGFLEPDIDQKDLRGYKMYFPNYDKNNRLMLPSRMRLMALHQIGHALGITSHSKNTSTIMCSAPTVQKISKRDVSTLYLLYNLEPDISDFSRVVVVDKKKTDDKLDNSGDNIVAPDEKESEPVYSKPKEKKKKVRTKFQVKDIDE
jgi:tetratricopeptide (TPR) repeat protein